MKSKQLEFGFVDDHRPKKRTCNGALLALFDCQSQMWWLLHDLKEALCIRRCAEIETQNHWIKTKAVGSDEEWKPVYDIVEQLNKLQKKIFRIQIFLRDHYLETLE